MNWLTSLLGRSGASVAKLAPRGRFVVADLVTSGPDPRHDRLLAIGAVVVENGRVQLKERFQANFPAAGGTGQKAVQAYTPQGAESDSEILRHWRGFVGTSPIVSCAAGSVQAVLQRSLREALGLRTRSRVVDLEAALAAVDPQLRGDLQQWLARFHLPPRGGTPLDNAVILAQLLLVALKLTAKLDPPALAIQVDNAQSQ